MPSILLTSSSCHLEPICSILLESLTNPSSLLSANLHVEEDLVGDLGVRRGGRFSASSSARRRGRRRRRRRCRGAVKGAGARSEQRNQGQQEEQRERRAAHFFSFKEFCCGV